MLDHAKRAVVIRLAALCGGTSRNGTWRDCGGVSLLAQAIFIPFALAIFLTFILSPPVAKLERFGVRRTPAVIVVVLSTTLVLGGTGWIVMRQLVELVQEMPKFSGNIKTKIKSLRNITEGSATNRLTRMADEISEELRWNLIDRGHSAEMKAAAERAR